MPSSAPPLVPDTDQVFLDHAGLFVPDFQEPPAQLCRLGFTLTPMARHTSCAPAGGPPAPSGTGNQCLMFREGYLEMLAPTGEDTPLAKQFRKGLARYAGLHLIAFSVPDAEACHTELPARGIQPLPLVKLTRQIPTQDSEGTGRFHVVRVPPETMPEGRIQILTHYTPDLVWQPRWMDHENRAEALTGVLICVEDSRETRSRFSRFIHRRTQTGSKDVPLDRGRVTVIKPSVLARYLPGVEAPCVPFMAAVSFRSGDLDATRTLLEGRGIRCETLKDGRLLVPREEALGAVFVFHDANTKPWP